jgi:hypothetical protein
LPSCAMEAEGAPIEAATKMAKAATMMPMM